MNVAVAILFKFAFGRTFGKQFSSGGARSYRAVALAAVLAVNAEALFLCDLLARAHP